MAPKTLNVWRVTAGSFARLYFTNYHAEQMAVALRRKGIDVTIDTLRVPNDKLTILSVQA